jgi:hypothetical protein
MSQLLNEAQLVRPTLFSAVPRIWNFIHSGRNAHRIIVILGRERSIRLTSTNVLQSTKRPWTSPYSSQKARYCRVSFM